MQRQARSADPRHYNVRAAGSGWSHAFVIIQCSRQRGKKTADAESAIDMMAAASAGLAMKGVNCGPMEAMKRLKVCVVFISVGAAMRVCMFARQSSGAQAIDHSGPPLPNMKLF